MKLPNTNNLYLFMSKGMTTKGEAPTALDTRRTSTAVSYMSVGHLGSQTPPRLPGSPARRRAQGLEEGQGKHEGATRKTSPEGGDRADVRMGHQETSTSSGSSASI